MGLGGGAAAQQRGRRQRARLDPVRGLQQVVVYLLGDDRIFPAKIYYLCVVAP